MAEVPEVEIFARDMAELVVGRTIAGVTVLNPAALRFPEPPAFAALLDGRRFEAVERRAKFIVCHMSGGVTLAMHMMLHGTLRLFPADTPPEPQTMLIYALGDGEDLQLRDRDGFARAAAGPHEELAARLKLGELGPEMLDPAFGPDGLLARLGRRRSKMKVALVDQKILAGLGSRDADESLWQAMINPLRPANTLTAEEAARLLPEVRAVLDEGIALRGTMPDLRGKQGAATQRRKVYGRAGEPCLRCGTPIERTWLGQLMTHWCPRCQPWPIEG
jgi:formamidopyrimidine-DNA glycosylase